MSSIVDADAKQQSSSSSINPAMGSSTASGAGSSLAGEGRPTGAESPSPSESPSEWEQAVVGATAAMDFFLAFLQQQEEESPRLPEKTNGTGREGRAGDAAGGLGQVGEGQAGSGAKPWSPSAAVSGGSGREADSAGKGQAGREGMRGLSGGGDSDAAAEAPLQEGHRGERDVVQQMAERESEGSRNKGASVEEEPADPESITAEKHATNYDADIEAISKLPYPYSELTREIYDLARQAMKDSEADEPAESPAQAPAGEEAVSEASSAQQDALISMPRFTLLGVTLKASDNEDGEATAKAMASIVSKATMQFHEAIRNGTVPAKPENPVFIANAGESGPPLTLRND